MHNNFPRFPNDYYDNESRAYYNIIMVHWHTSLLRRWWNLLRSAVLSLATSTWLDRLSDRIQSSSSVQSYMITLICNTDHPLPQWQTIDYIFPLYNLWTSAANSTPSSCRSPPPPPNLARLYPSRLACLQTLFIRIMRTKHWAWSHHSRKALSERRSLVLRSPICKPIATRGVKISGREQTERPRTKSRICYSAESASSIACLRGRALPQANSHSIQAHSIVLLQLGNRIVVELWSPDRLGSLCVSVWVWWWLTPTLPSPTSSPGCSSS